VDPGGDSIMGIGGKVYKMLSKKKDEMVPKTRGKNATAPSKGSEEATPYEKGVGRNGDAVEIPSVTASSRTKASLKAAKEYARITRIKPSKRTPEDIIWLAKYNRQQKSSEQTARIKSSETRRKKSSPGVVPLTALEKRRATKKAKKGPVDYETGEVLNQAEYDKLTANQKALADSNAKARGGGSAKKTESTAATRNIMSSAVEKKWRDKMGPEYRKFITSKLRKNKRYTFDPADARKWMENKKKKEK
jgi:hypothetical protein